MSDIEETRLLAAFRSLDADRKAATLRAVELQAQMDQAKANLRAKPVVISPTEVIEADLIDKLALAISTHLKPQPIPLSVDLWDIATIAAFLKRDPQVVRERMACTPSFPKAIRLPTKNGRAQPLYKAKEVMEWTERFRDKN
ncbi:hypothetical protein ACN9MU_16530 [Pseudoduganella sp. R-32]|uniref:hypothetical protein n=1 Tax=Pseudoduganella sp. R-32 TaxID=3404061 RepID=UPI003CEAB99E